MVPFRSHLAGILICLAASMARGDELLSRWLTRQSEIKTWSADFTQTRALKALTQPLMATGQVWFAAPNQFRWVLGNPPETIALRTPDTLWVIYPPLKRAEKYPLTGGGLGPWKETLALLDAGFPQNENDLKSHFKILSTSEKGGRGKIELEPKSAGAKRMMPLLKIEVSLEDMNLAATELRFADGSTLRNDFRAPKKNPPLPENLFNPPGAPEVEIVEPLKSR
jgi:outer membrane lipoprotein-sorting protein